MTKKWYLEYTDLVVSRNRYFKFRKPGILKYVFLSVKDSFHCEMKIVKNWEYYRFQWKQTNFEDFARSTCYEKSVKNSPILIHIGKLSYRACGPMPLQPEERRTGSESSSWKIVIHRRDNGQILGQTPQQTPPSCRSSYDSGNGSSTVWNNWWRLDKKCLTGWWFVNL